MDRLFIQEEVIDLVERLEYCVAFLLESAPIELGGFERGIYKCERFLHLRLNGELELIWIGLANYA